MSARDQTPTEMEALVVRALARRPERLEVLRSVAALALPDGWVGAGFVRNAAWDELHGLDGAAPAADVDVVYFDPKAADRGAEQRELQTLRSAAPHVPWSVKNQARMHLTNGDRPYRDVADAMTFWPETCTAVAARLNGERIELLAPFGLGDLISLRVRPTPRFHGKLAIYRERMAAKRWRERWPRLVIEFPS